MIRNIIFDIGNVLAGFVWEEFYRSFGFDEETLRRMAAATVRNPLWYEMDQGNMTPEEIIRGFKEYDPSIEKEIGLVFADIGGIISPYGYACPWVSELKERGYAVYVISNISEQVLHDCKEALTFIDLLDGAVLSCRIKMQKPDEAVYRHFLKRFGCDPAECIFLDDQERNIAAAANQGIRGIVFHNYWQARQELEEMLTQGNTE